MPTKDKKRGTWTGVVQRRGFPLRKKRGFKTKSAAAEWERVEVRLLTSPPEETPLTFVQACTDYLAWCQKRRKLNTYRQKAFIIRSFISAIQQDPPLDKITNKMIEIYLDQRFESVGGKSANRDCRELKTAFNWFIDRGLMGLNPCRGIEPYKEEPFTRYVPSPEDINKVMLVADGWESDFIQCVYHTAARRVEILRLTWDDINFGTSTIKLWTRKRKGGSLESDELAMNEVLQSVLENRYRTRDQESQYVFPSKTHRRISKNTIVKVMPKLCKEAIVKPFGFHAIRHYVSAVMMDSKKLSLVDIQKMLRHKRATTTDIYLNQLSESKNTAADVLGNSIKKQVQPIVQPTETKNGTDSK